MRLVRHWNKLPRGVDAPALEVFEVRVDRTLSNLTKQQMSAPFAGRVD